MNIFWAILSPLLFNLSGLIDTFLTKKIKKEQKFGKLYNSVGTLMIIGGTIAFLVSLVLFSIYFNEIKNIGLYNIIILLLSGVFYGYAVFPYLKALQGEKIENIISMFQILPVFVYILGIFFLGEYLSFQKVILIILIVVLSLFFGRNINDRKFNLKGILLIFLSVFLYSLSGIFFKIGGTEISNIGVFLFWEHLGIALVSVYRLLDKKIRISTIKYIKTQNRNFLILNIINELLYIIGSIILNVLILYHPVVIVDTISNGIQPIMLFLMVYIFHKIFHKIFPKIFEWKYNKKEIIYKISICVILVALVVIFSIF